MSFFGEDPVAKGLANSLARPGGSATGVAMMAAQLDGKRASLLHEFVPAARRIAILSGRPPRNVGGAEEPRAPAPACAPAGPRMSREVQHWPALSLDAKTLKRQS